jgi:hypothetical protein
LGSSWDDDQQSSSLPGPYYYCGEEYGMSPEGAALAPPALLGSSHRPQEHAAGALLGQGAGAGGTCAGAVAAAAAGQQAGQREHGQQGAAEGSQVQAAVRQGALVPRQPLMIHVPSGLLAPPPRPGAERPALSPAASQALPPAGDTWGPATAPPPSAQQPKPAEVQQRPQMLAQAQHPRSCASSAGSSRGQAAAAAGGASGGCSPPRAAAAPAAPDVSELDKLCAAAAAALLEAPLLPLRIGRLPPDGSAGGRSTRQLGSTLHQLAPASPRHADAGSAAGSASSGSTLYMSVVRLAGAPGGQQGGAASADSDKAPLLQRRQSGGLSEVLGWWGRGRSASGGSSGGGGRGAARCMRSVSDLQHLS